MTKDIQVEVNPTAKKQATTSKLILGLLFDAIGMMSYAVPILAEVTDIIWAPIAAFAMTMMYKGTVGKAAGVIAFVEEIIPGLDFIPTFTLTWLYEYYLDKKNNL
jgi:hypothetical protein